MRTKKVQYTKTGKYTRRIQKGGAENLLLDLVEKVKNGDAESIELMKRYDAFLQLLEIDDDDENAVQQFLTEEHNKDLYPIINAAFELNESMDTKVQTPENLKTILSNKGSKEVTEIITKKPGFFSWVSSLFEKKTPKEAKIDKKVLQSEGIPTESEPVSQAKHQVGGRQPSWRTTFPQTWPSVYLTTPSTPIQASTAASSIPSQPSAEPASAAASSTPSQPSAEPASAAASSTPSQPSAEPAATSAAASSTSQSSAEPAAASAAASISQPAVANPALDTCMQDSQIIFDPDDINNNCTDIPDIPVDPKHDKLEYPTRAQIQENFTIIKARVEEGVKNNGGWEMYKNTPISNMFEKVGNRIRLRPHPTKDLPKKRLNFNNLLEHAKLEDITSDEPQIKNYKDIVSDKTKDINTLLKECIVNYIYEYNLNKLYKLKKSTIGSKLRQSAGVFYLLYNALIQTGITKDLIKILGGIVNVGITFFYNIFGKDSKQATKEATSEFSQINKGIDSTREGYQGVASLGIVPNNPKDVGIALLRPWRSFISKNMTDEIFELLINKMRQAILSSKHYNIQIPGIVFIRKKHANGFLTVVGPNKNYTSIFNRMFIRNEKRYNIYKDELINEFKNLFTESLKIEKYRERSWNESFIKQIGFT